MSKVWRIVLTGGPCSGKTTSIMRLKNFLENRGFFVVCVPETATLLRTSGISWTPIDPNAFQKTITETQVRHEDVFFEYASKIARAKNCSAIVICDRGLIDGSIYVTEDMYNDCLSQCDLPELSKLYDRYDSVFHLVTAALGAEKFYTTGAMRQETKEQAIENDFQLIKAWKPHPYHYIFDNDNKSFEEKLRTIVGQICNILKLPDTSKIPKKLLLKKLPKIPNNLEFIKSHLWKIYLVGHHGLSKQFSNEYSFIRLRKINDSFNYVLKNVTYEEGQRIERKQILSERQFEEYKQFSDNSRYIVEQERTFITAGSTHYEICEYVTPSKGLILLNIYSEEIDHSKINSPDWFAVEKDVTDDFEYSSHFLSLRDPSLKNASNVIDETKSNSLDISSGKGCQKKIGNGVVRGCF